MAPKSVEPIIKVLIVDDEQLVRQGLRMTVDWEKHQMVVVADSPNGLMGWEAFLKHRPQVVITDIVMPEMDGIELAKKIKADYPETKLLFLSCHRDFAYARQGIQLGITDYIVKTSFDDEQMNECLGKIHSELMQSKLGSYASFMTMEKPEQGQSADELLSIWLTEKKQAAVIPLRQRLDKEWKRMACGGHLFHLFLNHAGNSGEAGIEPLKERLQALPCALNETAVVLPNGADSVFLLCGKEHLDVCKNELLEMKLNNPLLEWRSEESIRDASAWLAAVHKMHRLRQIELQTELHTRIHKDDILQAIDFIDQHLHMDIRASELANKIGVSRSYFSTIFKEATGSSLITFISDRKVNRAKELLRVTNLRTDEVAEQVGIQDVKYFSKWFKKCVSQTPSQYRVQTK